MHLDTMIAQAAVDGMGKTNRDWGRGLLGRFEEATGLPPEVVAWSKDIIVAMVILVVGFFLASLARNLVKRLFSRRNLEPTMAGFVGNIAHIAIMIFVAVTALGQVGVDTKSFAAVIAATGLAIGLALQGGLSNFCAGFLIIIFRPFRSGDVINAAGIEGTVQDVQIFSTTLNTADNKRIIVPNSSFINGTITNYTTNAVRRVDLQFGVGVGQDLSKAHQTLLALAHADPRILKEPAPAVANVKLIDAGVQVELRAWCKTSDHGGLTSDLLAKAPASLLAQGIKPPERAVYLLEKR